MKFLKRFNESIDNKILKLTDSQIDKICEFYNYCLKNSIKSDRFDEMEDLLNDNGLLDTPDDGEYRVNSGFINPVTFKTWVNNMNTMLYNILAKQELLTPLDKLFAITPKAIPDMKEFNEVMIHNYEQIKDFVKFNPEDVDSINSCIFDILDDNSNLDSSISKRYIESNDVVVPQYLVIFHVNDTDNVKYRGNSYTFSDLSQYFTKKDSVLYKKLNFYFNHIHITYRDSNLLMITIK